MLSSVLSTPLTKLVLALGVLSSSVGSARAASSAASTYDGRSLYTSSVTYCAPPTGIIVSDFSFQYYPYNNSAYFSLSAASVSDDLNLVASISIEAYDLINKTFTIDLCSLAGGLLCPLPMVNFTGGSGLPIPSDIVGALPSITWTVPDLSAIVQVRFNDVSSGELVACLQATLANGKTTNLTAVLWATAGMALLALFVSWFHTAWNLCRHDSQLSSEAGLVTGSSSPGQWRVIDVVYIFQVIASTGLLTLDYPTVYPAFVQNFRWALGLYNTPKVQDAIDSGRDKTGAKLTSTAYPGAQYINRKTDYSSPIGGTSSVTTSSFAAKAASLNSLSTVDNSLVSSTPSSYSSFVDPSTLPVIDSLSAINASSLSTTLAPSSVVAKRLIDLDHNSAVEVLAAVPTTSSTSGGLSTGIPVYVNSLGIPTANAFFTLFFTWLFLWAVFLALHALLYVVLLLLTKSRERTTWSGEKRVEPRRGWLYRLRRNFGRFFLTNVLRMTQITFFPIMIFTLYQFSLKDAWLPQLLAAIVFVITILTLLISSGLLFAAARKSHNNVPRSSLNPNEPIPASSSDPAYIPEQRRHSLNSDRRGSLDPDYSHNPAFRQDSTVAPHEVIHHRTMFSPFPTLRPAAAGLYQSFRSPLYLFALLPLFAMFAKACFIGLAQGHGKVQILGLVIIEGLLLIALLAFRPHTNKKGDWLSVTLALFRLVGTGIMLAWIDDWFSPTGLIRTILGFVCIAVWGIAVVLLFFGVIYNLFWGIIWKRHTPQAHLAQDEAYLSPINVEPKPILLDSDQSEKNPLRNSSLSHQPSNNSDPSSYHNSPAGFVPLAAPQEHHYDQQPYANGASYPSDAEGRPTTRGSQTPPPFLNGPPLHADDHGARATSGYYGGGSADAMYEGQPTMNESRSSRPLSNPPTGHAY